MSTYDDPPEPTEDEMNEYEQEQAVKRSTAVRIEGLNAEVVDVIVRQVVRDTYRIEEKVHEAIEKKIDETVSGLIREAVKERAVAAVDRAIAEGFAEFDSWSGAVKRRTTVAELVHKQMTEKSRERYDKPDTTLAERCVANAVAALFDKALEAEIAKVKSDFRQQADEVFKAKLVAGIKEAIGLRT